ncbi:MAG: tRNA epoxyqueuosine(34) reductase QueG [Gemmatimonadales bacterium]
MSPEARAHRVKQCASRLGFDTVGITHLDPTPHRDALDRWLERGMAGSMTYMARQAPHRREPATIVPGAARAIMLTRNYYQPDRPPPPDTGRVAKYARGRDYHAALAQPLEALATEVRALGGPTTTVRWYVDAGPVPERELAQRAGLGWIGKNTMLIDPRRGSFSFLAAVLTDLDLAVDPPLHADRCGTCRRCLDACPTDAFPEARVLDSRRCISYLTIEHSGDIAPELQAMMGDRLFGCDICQDVCPWNERFAQPADDPQLDQRDELGALDLARMTTISDTAFEREFAWTPLERPGPQGLRRNARIAAANRRRRAETEPA